MVDRTEMMTKAAAWMQACGWRRKLAKEREFARELLGHASIELRVLNGPNG